MTAEEAKNRIYLHGETMTEDEAIVILDALEKQTAKIATVELKLTEVDEVKSALKELQWYRSQDLIRREDAIEISTQMQWHDENGYPVDDYEDKKQYSKDWIEQVPKAEPPTSSKMEQVDKDINVPSEFATDTNVARNGDCETCKFYKGADDRWCKFCSITSDKYEPYIPKE